MPTTTGRELDDFQSRYSLDDIFILALRCSDGRSERFLLACFSSRLFVGYIISDRSDLILLVEAGTHLITDALMCPYRMGEQLLSEQYWGGF